MLTAVVSGFLLGFSLILAIGAQNAFVLRQGLRGAHVFAVCLTCALSDAVLIAAGVAGVGALAQAVPLLVELMRWSGATFLLVYGLISLRRALTGASALAAAGGGAQSLTAALLTVLGFTWLNPHVYLDTVLLVGSISAQSDHPALFGAGAVTASFVFFFALGYGARRLAPVFARPRAWQVLDAGIAAIMFVIAARLVVM